MPLIHSESNLPFDFKRVQFPIRPAFAMSINKAQGQTLSFVGLWLEDPVFSHGQLYVALSRVSSRDNLKISLGRNKTNGPNFTKNIVFPHVFT